MKTIIKVEIATVKEIEKYANYDLSLLTTAPNLIQISVYKTFSKS